MAPKSTIRVLFALKSDKVLKHKSVYINSQKSTVMTLRTKSIGSKMALKCVFFYTAIMPFISLFRKIYVYGLKLLMKIYDEYF